jgi:hypothetical protein
VFCACTKPSFLLIDYLAVESFFVNTAVYSLNPMNLTSKFFQVIFLRRRYSREIDNVRMSISVRISTTKDILCYNFERGKKI